MKILSNNIKNKNSKCMQILNECMNFKNINLTVHIVYNKTKQHESMLRSGNE